MLPLVWRTEIADLAGVWRVVPASERPHRVCRELAECDNPAAATWRQLPIGSGEQAIVFSYAVPNGATVRARLTGSGLAGAKVVARLLGKGESEFWPLWTWRPELDEAGAEFATQAPAGGEWVGGVITVAGVDPARIALEVKSLLIEEQRQPSTRPNLILVTLDTFRADHVSCLNSQAGLTPTLDSLAAVGTLFDQAVATSQCTGPSHASMMTGLYCFAHGVYQNTEGLSSAAVTIADVLSQAGYRTLGAVSIAHLNPTTSNLGQGFGMFIDSRWPGVGGEPADVQTARVVRALQLVPQDGPPWFLWVHYFDPHTPYTPPSAGVDWCIGPNTTDEVRYRNGMGAVQYDTTTGLVRDPRGEVLRYGGEVMFLDRQLDALFAGLRRLGILEHAVVTVVADHGEGLGEHGIYFEHAGMFQEVLQVPLIMSGAGIPSARRISTRVSGVDVFPTLLARAEVRKIPANYGRDLLRIADGPRTPRREIIFAESVGGAIRAAWEGDGKLLWVPDGKPDNWSVPERMMYFDLGADPSESDNRIKSARDALRLKTAFEKAKRRPLVSLRGQQAIADTDRLRALGYMQ